MYFQNPFEAAEQRTVVAHGATVGQVIKPIKPRMGRQTNRELIFCRPLRGWNVWLASQPTVALSFRHSVAAILDYENAH
jgi:hypothetical protein